MPVLLLVLLPMLVTMSVRGFGRRARPSAASGVVSSKASGTEAGEVRGTALLLQTQREGQAAQGEPEWQPRPVRKAEPSHAPHTWLRPPPTAGPKAAHTSSAWT